jgi:hypothetical protein
VADTATAEIFFSATCPASATAEERSTAVETLAIFEESTVDVTFAAVRLAEVLCAPAAESAVDVLSLCPDKERDCEDKESVDDADTTTGTVTGTGATICTGTAMGSGVLLTARVVVSIAVTVVCLAVSALALFDASDRCADTVVDEWVVAAVASALVLADPCTVFGNSVRVAETEF